MTECAHCKECNKELHKTYLLLIAEQQKNELYRQLLEQKFVLSISSDQSRVDDLINSINTRFFGSQHSQSKSSQPLQSQQTVQSQQTTKRKHFKSAPKTLDIIEETSDVYGCDIKAVDEKILQENISVFGSYDIDINNDLFNDNIKQLSIAKNTKDCTNILSTIRNQRQIFQLTMTPSEYSTFLVGHVDIIKKCINENQNIDKKLEPKKMSTLLSKILTSLEQRILFHQGFQNQNLSTDELKKFERCLKLSAKHPKTYRTFSAEHMCEFFTNYSLAICNIEYMFEHYIVNPYGFKNIIFIQLENDFAFYTLDKYDDTTKTRYWILDSRLEMMTLSLREVIRDYCIMLFRKIYKQCFGTNDFIETYNTKYNVLEFDCEQLLQNALKTIDFKILNKTFTELVKKHCIYSPSQNDKFDSTTDSEDQVRMFKRYSVSNDDVKAVVSSIFDNIKDSQIFNIYKM